MSTPGPTPHATGYEDAITRRIGGLEAKAAALQADLERAQAQANGLVEDNARLRSRAAEADAALGAARRTRTLGIALIVVALVLVGVAAVLRFSFKP